LIEFTAVEKILDTYTLEQILELNGLTEADALFYMLNQEFVQLPNPLPVDIDE
jgi:hypothetical protein